MLPFLQLVLLLFTTLLFHIGCTNPNPVNNTDYIPDEGMGTVFVTKYAPALGKIGIWTMTLYQVLYLSLQIFIPSLISVLFPQLPMFADPLPWTSALVLGYILMIIGGLGRLWCYRTLGEFFTYQITIRHSHKLIRSGPYAYARHPSYTFVIFLVVGTLLVQQRVTNFFPHKQWSTILSDPRAILITWIVVLLILIRRVIREEEELQKKFGKEWSQYASETNRFIPGLI